MLRKIALKRLSNSDLTVFEDHYRQTAGTKQKAINLDADVFIEALYPSLPRWFVFRDRVILTLSIYGPGEAPPQTITRKILKQQKNWRLNGELINSTPEEPGRYNSLQKGDYALMEFSGDSEPNDAKMYLISKKKDKALFDAVDEEFGSEFSPRRGMIALTHDRFAAVMLHAAVEDSHPIYDFVESELLGEAALGNSDAIRRINRRRAGRGVSLDELTIARSNAEYIGREGEDLINSCFLHNPEIPTLFSILKSEFSHCWESNINAVAPYDFSLMNTGKIVRRIDVKSTSGPFGNAIHMSVAELTEAALGPVPYGIVRVFSLNNGKAKMRIALDVKDFSAKVLNNIQTLQEGVQVDSFSIKPGLLNFGPEVEIEFYDDWQDIA